MSSEFNEFRMVRSSYPQRGGKALCAIKVKVPRTTTSWSKWCRGYESMRLVSVIMQLMLEQGGKCSREVYLEFLSVLVREYG